MNKDVETSGCLLGILYAGAFAIGLLLCIFSRFLCIELDYSEGQRNACEIKSSFILFFGFLIIIGSTVVMVFSDRILAFFAKNSNNNE